MRAAHAWLAAAWLAAACGAGAQPEGDGGATSPASAPGAANTAASVAASEPLPEHLGIGREATPEEIAALDIDVMPDGTGLPPGGATAADGAPVFAARCAACHGPEGGGATAAALVGRNPGDAFDYATAEGMNRPRTIGSYWPYATTLFDYVRRAMPFDSPGTLTDDEVYAVVAWLLWKNEIIDEATVVDAATLPAVRMPARDHFVRDDRETSTRVR